MATASESQIKYAGTYDLLEANLISLSTGNVQSVKNYFRTLTITESMYTSYISGTVRIVDARNLYKLLPITGKEILTFKTRDYYDNERTEAFFVYAMSNLEYVGTTDTNSVSYVLHFCSREKFISDCFDIKRKFSGLVHNQVALIYRDYIAQFDSEGSGLKVQGVPFKPLHLEQTDNSSSYVIPNYKPDEAINFLARRAHSNVNTSQTFMFWETRKSYNFGSPAWTYSATTAIDGEFPAFKYNPIIASESGDQNFLQREMYSVGLNGDFNTIDAHKNSGYISKAVELDINNRTPIETIYNHGQALDTAEGQLYLRHETGFINKYFAQAYTPLVIKDYLTPGINSSSGELSEFPTRDPQYYGELMAKNSAIDYNLRNNAFSVSVRGANNIEAGRVINISYPDSSDPTIDDRWGSGPCIVLKASHVYDGDRYTCNLTVSRGGLSASPYEYGAIQQEEDVVDENDPAQQETAQ